MKKPIELLYVAIGQLAPNGTPEALGTHTTESAAAKEAAEYLAQTGKPACAWVETISFIQKTTESAA